VLMRHEKYQQDDAKVIASLQLSAMDKEKNRRSDWS
jgi:hypothetical protein